MSFEVNLPTGGGTGSVFPPKDVSNISAVSGNGRITLKWTDPDDTVQDGVTFVTWDGTKVIRKAGAYPETERDGVVVVDNTVRNQYSSNGFTDTGLTNGETYYYGFFPYSKDKAYNRNVINRISVEPVLLLPLPITAAKAKAGDGQATIMWTDSEDIPATETTEAVAWEGTKVVRKVGSAPSNEDDGTVIVTNTVRNQYSSNGFADTGLTNGETYYYGFFPYSKDKAYCRTGNVSVNVIPTAYKTYGVIIDITNSNPNTAVTYTQSDSPSVGSDEWDDFFGFYPCLFKDGAEVGKLNPLNFAQFEDGSAADITSGDAGDVMIAFPRRGLKMYTSDDKIYIYITDDPNADGFTYYAHTRGEVDKELFYLGAYKGCVSNSKLRSLSGKLPTVSTTLTKFRTYAQNNGSGYELSAYYQLVLRQAMFIMKYKNLDSQTALGKGYTNSSSMSGTGISDKKGMNYGNDTSTTKVKLFGVEDCWGNLYEWVDGLFYNASRHILTATDNFNDKATGYTDQGASGLSSNSSGYVTAVSGSSEKGFFPIKFSGSSSTYFADHSYANAGCFGIAGGAWSAGVQAGAFCLGVYYAAASSYSSVGARLMYL